jgi:hypothetical protein
MKNFDPRYNDLPKIEIHCHLEGAIRTQTLIDVARQYHLPLPSYEIDKLERHVKVLDQARPGAVLEAFRLPEQLAAPEVVERIARAIEILPTCPAFEVDFPRLGVHRPPLDWDAASKDPARRRASVNSIWRSA